MAGGDRSHFIIAAGDQSLIPPLRAQKWRKTYEKWTVDGAFYDCVPSFGTVPPPLTFQPLTFLYAMKIYLLISFLSGCASFDGKRVKKNECKAFSLEELTCVHF